MDNQTYRFEVELGQSVFVFKGKDTVQTTQQLNKHVRKVDRYNSIPKLYVRLAILTADTNTVV